MTPTPPYQQQQKIKLLVMFACGLFAVICFGTWASERYGKINVDWSFFAPLIGFISAAIPLWITVRDQLTKKQAEFEKDINELKADVNVLKLDGETSRIERDHLKGRIIRIEITYSAFLDK